MQQAQNTTQNTSDTAKVTGGLDTVCTFELALIRLGFLTKKDFKFGRYDFDSLFTYDPSLRIYWRVYPFIEPDQIYLTFQLVVIDSGRRFGCYIIEGKNIEEKIREGLTVDLFSQVYFSVGELLHDSIIQEWKQQIERRRKAVEF